MTALTIIQKACGRLSLNIPAAIFSSTNDQVINLRNLLNEEVIDLARYHAWTRLITEKTFDAVADDVQTSSVPADFDWYIRDTMFNRTTSRRVVGPLTPQEWQATLANQAASAIYDSFRFRGGDILITPDPTAGDDIYYEYVTKYRVEDSDGNQDQEVFAADSDVAVLDEELHVQGLKWRWKQSKGLDYAEDFQTYFKNVEKAVARDGGSKIINLTSSSLRRAIRENIPEGSWDL
jgi:hypothetical protein